MINEQAKLASNIFNTPDMQATRDGFGTALVVLGEQNPAVLAVCADLSESTRMQAFKKKFPERYVEVGVAEQNLATVASGLAAMGKIPFMASYATFSPGRNNEQIRTTISLNERPVKIVGMHAGLSVGPDGATHQALEDIGLMRMQPNMVVLVPCDALEAHKATIAAANHDGPVYLRFSRESTPVLTTEHTPFNIGKAVMLWEGKDPQVTLVVSGILAHAVMLAAKELESEISVLVVNLHTVKPIDREVLVASAKKTQAVVTVEEHQVAGGVGSAVAEVLASECPVSVEFVGVHDRFGQSGEPKELLENYGMGVSHIVAAVRKVYSRKMSK